MRKNFRVRDSLSRKLVLVFLLVGLALSLAAFILIHTLVLPPFSHYEREQSRISLARVENFVQSELDRLTGDSLEYSAWDEIYEHVQNPEEKPDYLDYLSDGNYWSDINIELMLFYSSDGQLVWGRMISAEDSVELPLADTLRELPGLGHPLLEHTSEDSRVQGFLATGEGPLLVASTPILRSDRSGPMMGSVVVGRLLTPADVLDMERALSVGISVYPVSDGMMPAAARLAYERLLAADGPVTTVREGVNTVSRKVVNDLFDAPMLLVETRRFNQVSAIANQAVGTALVIMVLLIILFTFLGWWLLRRLVASPVLALKQHIARVRESGDLTVPFGSPREDELGKLASEFDALIQELDETQRQRDDAESLSRAKGKFLMSISHEIRTPMNGVIGMTDALLRMDLPENAQRLLGRVKSSGRILLNIIDDILDFSGVSSGQTLLANERFELRQMIADVNSAVADSAQSKGIEYLCRVDPGLPQSAVGDQQRIKQILINLIGNAIKFTHEGEVMLDVGCVTDAEKAMAVLHFSIADTGIGIPATSIDSIFNSFYQVNNGHDREYGGTGLGLSISRALIEAMGGEISVSSEYESGSTFRFEVPVSRVQTLADTAGRSEGLAGLRALVLSAHSPTRALLAEMLTAMGALVELADDPAVASASLARSGAQSYDLLLFDEGVGSGPGGEPVTAVLDLAREAGTATLLLCSVANEGSIDTGKLGIDACIAKPFMRDEVVAAIRKAMAQDEVATVAHKVDCNGRDSQQLQIDVLVVEDNEVNQELITHELAEIGADFVLARNGMEALKELACRAFDLVLMDCQMPVMDGYAATARIREMNIADKRGYPIPILAMTASASEFDQEECLAAGMDAYISKPYDFEKLLEQINALLPATRQLEMVLDAGPLDSIRELGNGQNNVLKRLIDVFLETTPEVVSELRDAVATGDAKGVRMSAHKLKSSSATLGASQVHSLARELEYLGRDDDLAQAPEMVAALLDAVDAAYTALQKERARCDVT